MPNEVLNVQVATLHLVATLDHDRLDVTLRGELDLVCTGPIAQVASLDLGRVTTITVDLHDLEFVDSSGIAAFLALLKSQESANRRVEFADPQPAVRRTFEVLGLGHLLNA